METYQILDAASMIGYMMLQYGAEIYRVEDSIRRICRAYHVNALDVFAIPSSIVVTITEPDGHCFTKTKRIVDRSNDFDKLHELNSLSRRICRDTPSYEEIWEALREINGRPAYSFWAQMGAFSLISASFAIFYGGDLTDAIWAAPIGALVKIILDFMVKLQSSGFFCNVVCSCVAAFFSLLCTKLGLSHNMDCMTIGILMNLVPGIALTNSMRDFISGDPLAGIIKLAEALLVATSVAAGVMVALVYLRPLLEVFL